MVLFPSALPAECVPCRVAGVTATGAGYPWLARFFLTKYAKKFGNHFDEIDPAGLEYLRQYAWSGNVREMQNVLTSSPILLFKTL